jgi:hypothetical protein
MLDEYQKKLLDYYGYTKDLVDFDVLILKLDRYMERIERLDKCQRKEKIHRIFNSWFGQILTRFEKCSKLAAWQKIST